MPTKKELLDSILIRRILYNRIIGLGVVVRNYETTGKLPLPNKEGSATHKKDNGGLFVRRELIAEETYMSETDLIPFDEGKPSVKTLENLVDEALTKEKATLIGKTGWTQEVLLDIFDFYPEIAKKITKLLINEKKIGSLPSIKQELLKKHMVTSYLPPEEGVGYGCRTELATFLSLCSAFWEKYEILAEPKKAERLVDAKMPIDGDGTVLMRHSVVHASNSRLLEESIVAPVSILGYGNKFGEFSMITFERKNTAERKLVSLGKSPLLGEYNRLVESNGEEYYGLLTIFGGTDPGKRKPAQNVIVIHPEKDMGLSKKQISDAFRQGYEEAA